MLLKDMLQFRGNSWLSCIADNSLPVNMVLLWGDWSHDQLLQKAYSIVF